MDLAGQVSMPAVLSQTSPTSFKDAFEGIRCQKNQSGPNHLFLSTPWWSKACKSAHFRILPNRCAGLTSDVKEVLGLTSNGSFSANLLPY